LKFGEIFCQNHKLHVRTIPTYRVYRLYDKQWFKGQISNYGGLTGKYGIYFPCDGGTVYVYPNDKDMRFVC